MELSNFRQATFVKSVAALKQLPPGTGGEVAFAGRSNAGKSSALNTITDQKSLARVSKTPGRTQMLNYFTYPSDIDDPSEADDKYLVDLPGYGYAKVNRQMQENWQNLLQSYLETRTCLRGLVLIMDIRHPLKETDAMLLQWSHEQEIPVHILLTKADKFKRNAQNNARFAVEEALVHFDLVTTQTFSSLNKQGLEQAREVIATWLDT